MKNQTITRSYRESERVFSTIILLIFATILTMACIFGCKKEKTVTPSNTVNTTTVTSVYHPSAAERQLLGKWIVKKCKSVNGSYIVPITDTLNFFRLDSVLAYPSQNAYRKSGLQYTPSTSKNLMLAWYVYNSKTHDFSVDAGQVDPWTMTLVTTMDTLRIYTGSISNGNNTKWVYWCTKH